MFKYLFKDQSQLIMLNADFLGATISHFYGDAIRYSKVRHTRIPVILKIFVSTFKYIAVYYDLLTYYYYLPYILQNLKKIVRKSRPTI